MPPNNDEQTEKLAEVVAKTVTNALKLHNKANGYVGRSEWKHTTGMLKQTVETLANTVTDMHQDVREQRVEVASLSKELKEYAGSADECKRTVDLHLKEHEVVERGQDRDVKFQTLKVRQRKFWVWVVVAAIGLLGTFGGFAYALGKMETRIMQTIEKRDGGNANGGTTP